MDTVPLACNLAAFTPAQRQRYAVLADQLRQAVREVRELADGYAFEYVADDTIWRTAAEYVDLERRCCPFFTFTLVREAGGAVCLHFTGPAGVKDMLAAQMPAS